MCSSPEAARRRPARPGWRCRRRVCRAAVPGVSRILGPAARGAGGGAAARWTGQWPGSSIGRECAGLGPHRLLTRLLRKPRLWRLAPSFCLCGKKTPTSGPSVTGTPMRHTFPPEPRKAKLPSQGAGFLPGSLETLSNLCLPGQAATWLDLPPTSRSCESHSRDPIHPCQGRTRVGEHPATPGTGRPAQGPGGGSGLPTTHPHLPALQPRGWGETVHRLARLQKTERAEATRGGVRRRQGLGRAPSTNTAGGWRSAWAIHSTEE